MAEFPSPFARLARFRRYSSPQVYANLSDSSPDEKPKKKGAPPPRAARYETQTLGRSTPPLRIPSSGSGGTRVVKPKISNNAGSLGINLRVPTPINDGRNRREALFMTRSPCGGIAEGNTRRRKSTVLTLRNFLTPSRGTAKTRKFRARAASVSVSASGNIVDILDTGVLDENLKKKVNLLSDFEEWSSTCEEAS